MRRFTRSTALLGTVLLLLSVIASCGPPIVTTGKSNLHAQFREQGSACELEIVFSTIVFSDDAEKRSFYRKESGDQPESVLLMADNHTVVIAFASPVSSSDVIEVGAYDTTRQSVRVSQNGSDQAPPQLLEAYFAVDAVEPAIVLVFDEAIDSVGGEDPTNYTLTGSNEHPRSTTMTDCGRSITLVFDTLSGNSVLDVMDVADLNGNVLDARLNVTVAPSVDHASPEIKSLTIVSDSSEPQILASFTEAVDRDSAETNSNYVIRPEGVSPVAAALQAGGQSVLLTFARLIPPVTLDVANVADLNGNALAGLQQHPVAVEDDELPPEVNSAVLVENDEGLTIELTFTEAVLARSAQTTANYELRSDGGEAGVNPTSAVLQDGGSIVVLVFEFVPPDATLDVVNVSDLAGNAVIHAISIGVNVQAGMPRVLSILFVPNATKPMIDVTFNKPLAIGSAQDIDNYALNGETAPVSAELRDDRRTVRLTTMPLDRDDTLSVHSIVDVEGNLMDAVVAQPIAITGDLQDPQVVQVAFAANAQRPTVRIVFSEVVDRSDALSLDRFIGTPDSQNAVAAEIEDDGRTVMLTFGPMNRSTKLQITNLNDLAGRSFVSTTVDIESDSETVLPKIESAAFVPGASAPTIELVFSEAPDKRAAQTPGLYLAGSDRVAATSAVLLDDGRTVQLSFPPMENTDTLDVRSVTDLNGNELLPVPALDVAIAPDDKPPFVESAKFAANGTVPTVTILFSEAVDESSAEDVTHFQAMPGNVRPDTAVLQNDSRTLTLTFPPIEREDYLDISDIRDFGDNAIEDASSTAISPDLELVPPTVGSATVTTSSSITVIFNEAVDESSAETIANYSGLASSRTVSSAELQSDGKSVVLAISGGTVVSGGLITIRSIMDLNGNVMVTDTGRTLN